MFFDYSSLIRPNPAQLHYGAGVIDVDGDGEFEIFVAGYGGPNRVLKWTGQEFLDVASADLADPNRWAIGVAGADINGDGREEIYILNTDTFSGRKRAGDRLFLWRGQRWFDLFTVEENQPLMNLTAGRSVVAVDRYGTGQYGFFLANYGGPMRLYEFADGQLADVASAAGLAYITGGRGLIALPLISDRMDIFAGNEMGPNFLFINQGDGTFTECAAQWGIDDPYEHVRGIAVLDADHDGALGLTYGNWEGNHRLFVRNNGQFSDAAPLALARPSRVRTVIAADFDNDGYEEIFFNNIGQPNRLFAWRDAQWQAVDIGDAAEANGMGTGAAIGDFDDDGRLELFITHGESGQQPLSYYKTADQGHCWLRVLPLTTAGAPARGAIVKVQAGGRQQIRAVDAGSGYLCQMEPVAHFGLGTLNQVDEVTVIWPDGRQANVAVDEVDTTIRVPHPDAL